MTDITWTPALLAPGESTLFVTSGPDGNAWATEQTKGQIFKIEADGSVTRYPLPANTTPGPITAGPDGNLWFTAQQGSGSGAVSVFGKITTSGVVTIFPYPNPSAFLATPPSAAIAGSSDGFVYAADAPTEKLGRITPATGAVTEFLLGHAPGEIAALSDGSLVVAEPGSGHFVARVVNGVVTQVTIPGGVIPSGVSACTFGGTEGFCVSDSHGFQSNFLVECMLSGSCASYPIETNQCSAQRIACLGGDCYLAPPFCQEIVHADLTQTPPVSNIISFPPGFNARDIEILGAGNPSPTGVVAVGQDSASGDYRVFLGQVPSADLSVVLTLSRGTGLYEFRGKVSNSGPSFANSVVVFVSPSDEFLSLVSFDPQVSCSLSAGICTRSGLGVGETFSLDFIARSDVDGELRVSSGTPDPDPSNNEAAVSAIYNAITFEREPVPPRPRRGPG